MVSKNIILFSTFVIFTLEALLHYNIGKQSGKTKRTLLIPDIKELFEIAFVVFIFSYINSVVIPILEKAY